MSSSSDASLIAALNNASLQLNRYFGIFIYVFAIFGHGMNICVLSQRTLRSNPCAWLFLVSSVAYGIGIVAGLTSRILSTWNADLTNTDQFLCKFRALLVYSSLTSGSWLIVYAAIDRWLSSNIKTNIRQKSTLKNAQIATVVIVIAVTLVEAQHSYCYEANLTNTPIKCYARTVWCSILSDLYLALLTVMIPMILMVAFGFMTISNIRQSRFRIQQMQSTTGDHSHRGTTTVTVANNNEHRLVDRRLSIMLFIQVFTSCVLTLPLAIVKIYTTITRFNPKPLLSITIENFTFNLLLLIFFLYCGMPFYIYVLSGGSVFRKAIVTLLRGLGRKLMCQCH